MKLASLIALAAAAALIFFTPAAPNTIVRAAPTPSAKLMKEAEAKMVGAGYLDSLQGAYWALAEGPKMIPVLSTMLQREKYYEKKYDDAVGAFPFNAVWVLAQFKTPSARDALRRYYAQSKDSEALLAMKAWDARRKYGNSAGVLIIDNDLYQRPSEKSRVLAHLKGGEIVRRHGDSIENDHEQDARGGPTEYDEIQVIRTGQTGYVQRASDDFDPTF